MRWVPKQQNIWRNHCPSPFWECSHATRLNPQNQDIKKTRHREQRRNKGGEGAGEKKKKVALQMLLLSYSTVIFNACLLWLPPQRGWTSQIFTFPDSLAAKVTSWTMSRQWDEAILLRNFQTDSCALPSPPPWLKKRMAEEKISNSCPLLRKTWCLQLQQSSCGPVRGMWTQCADVTKSVNQS